MTDKQSRASMIADIVERYKMGTGQFTPELDSQSGGSAMTDKQPDALRLADALENRRASYVGAGGYNNDNTGAGYARQTLYDQDKECAAELRRLHKKCEALTADTIEEMRRITKIYRLETERDELLEILDRAVRRLEIAHANGDTIMREWIIDARDVIAKVEGQS